MLNIFTFFSHPLPFAERFHLIKQAGFDGVSLWWGDDDTDQDFELQPELARAAGLAIENIHVPFFTVNQLWSDSPLGNAVLSYYLQCIDDCADHSIPAMVMHACFGALLSPVNELGLARFGEIANHAEKRGVNVAIENLRATNEHAAYVLEHIDTPRLGLCYDSGHWHACKDKSPQFDFLARFGHRLMALHLHDNHGVDDDHILPFNGTIDWPTQIQAIAQTGRSAVPTTLEFSTDYEGFAPEEHLAQAYIRSKQLDGIRNT
ncbi:MAG: sugar phosphate isomerase/epimerase [Oscillospiraceae bacterium]|nr:sugar phosphate isomerase/epimerase [Oscillospiraceae bacterium]